MSKNRVNVRALISRSLIIKERGFNSYKGGDLLRRAPSNNASAGGDGAMKNAFNSMH